ADGGIRRLIDLDGGCDVSGQSLLSAWFQFIGYGFIFKRNLLKPYETVSLLSNQFITKNHP
ncbi:MAG: hypothetical protein IKV90_05465, partial [Clostridia bacterium]|nr:hypothetical protein [Clostridia bacterium]